VSVVYTLTRDNTFTIDYHAESGAPTPVNLTQHLYLNLDGHASGDILGHEMLLDASRFTPVRPDLIPTGELRPVSGSAFDFLRPSVIGARIDGPDEQLAHGDGYDHNFVLDVVQDTALPRAARLRAPRSGRVLELFTTEPGLQIYSGNGLHRGPVGKDGHRYGRAGRDSARDAALSGLTQPAQFPSTILRPGTVFRSRTVYRFSAE
jgi:aldose 1-epimerase